MLFGFQNPVTTQKHVVWCPYYGKNNKETVTTVVIFCSRLEYLKNLKITYFFQNVFNNVLSVCCKTYVMQQEKPYNDI